MYEPAGSTHGIYGDLRNSMDGRRSRSDGNLPFATGTGQDGRSVSALARRCGGGGSADLAVIGTVVELAVDLGVRLRDGGSGTASTVDGRSSRRVTTPSFSSRIRAAKLAVRALERHAGRSR
jgi:hypothetical protein